MHAPFSLPLRLPQPPSLLAPVLGVVLAVAAGTAATAALDSWVPATATGVVFYLAGVLVVSSRFGLIAGVSASALAVAGFSFFFLPPRHALTVSASGDLGSLAVFALAALATSRLAARVRAQTESDRRSTEEAELALESIRLLAAGEDPGPMLRRLSQGGPDSARRPRSRLQHTADRLLVAGRASTADAGAVLRGGGLAAGLHELSRQRDAATAAIQGEATLRRADAAKTALLRVVSHDLRSPLQAVLTAAEGLRMGELPAEDRELVETVLAESSRLNRLVADLLDVSRLQAGVVSPNEDWCDVSDVVSAAVRSVGLGATQAVTVDLGRDLPLVRADARQLERILANLVENALTASSRVGSVRVTASSDADHVRIHVLDRGPGVLEDERERIFEPFVRGADAIAGTGSGLGLAIAAGLAEANHARLRVENRPGGGSIFTLVVPV